MASSHWEHVDTGLERGQMEAVWEGSGSGTSVGGGPVVYRVRLCSKKALLSTSLTLFDRLWLSNNRLTSVPDCIRQLTGLIVYGIEHESVL